MHLLALTKRSAFTSEEKGIYLRDIVLTCSLPKEGQGKGLNRGLGLELGTPCSQ